MPRQAIAAKPQDAPDARRHGQLRRHVHANFMQACHTGKWASIFFKFLHIAFSVGGPDD
jgi:hypothetical protein